MVVIVAGEVPDLTPIIISVGQLMADDRSDPAIVHRPGGRKGDGRFKFSLLAIHSRFKLVLSGVLGLFRQQLAAPEQLNDPKVSVGMAMRVASLGESRDRKTATYCGNSGL